MKNMAIVLFIGYYIAWRRKQMNYSEWYQQKEEYEDRAYKLMNAMHSRAPWVTDVSYDFDESGICITWLDRDGYVCRWEEFNFVVLDSEYFDKALEEAQSEKRRKEELAQQQAQERQQQQDIADKENRRQLFERLKLEFA